MIDLNADELFKIRWLVRDCGQQAQQMATESFQVFEKGLEDYVTTVDRVLDQRLEAGFTALFPSDGVITEENAQSRTDFQANYDRLWLIDPLDGTEDFIAAKPHYAVMVGALEKYRPQAGWIYAPAFDVGYFGGVDWGLFQAEGDRPVIPLIATEPASPSAHHCPILIGYKDRRRYGDAILQAVPNAQFDSIGSFGLKVMRIISGQAGIYIYFNRRVKLWDTVGPLALAQAAGLVCCDLQGNPLRFTSDALDLNTLSHLQDIIIGWPSYVESLRPKLQQAIASVRLEQE